MITIAETLSRRWWLLLLFSLLGLGPAYVLDTYLPARYQSTVSLQLNPAARSSFLPYLADADYYSSQAQAIPLARTTIARARSFVPYEAAYAIEAGNYALNQDANGNPAPDADWAGAREAYDTAARLGSYSPEMYRDLAIVDEHLGDHAAALSAARHALSLDRYDKDSQALVQRLESQ